jgi:hypothetical protein
LSILFIIMMMMTMMIIIICKMQNSSHSINLKTLRRMLKNYEI